MSITNLSKKRLFSICKKLKLPLQQVVFVIISVAFLATLGIHGYATYTLISRTSGYTASVNLDSKDADTTENEQSVIHYLFGIGSGSDELIEEEPVQARRDLSNLTLHGVMANTDKNTEDSAIIGIDGMEKVYFIGQSLPNGTTLTAVYPDHVVLSYGYIEELLYFKKNESTDTYPERSGSMRDSSPWSNFSDQNPRQYNTPRHQNPRPMDIESIRSLREQLEKTDKLFN